MGKTRTYVVQVIGGREESMRHAIARELGLSDEDCFVPLCELPRKERGEWHSRRELLFPGYVFVNTNDPQMLLCSLKKVHGMTRLLGVDGENVTSLTKDEVAWLNAMTGSGAHAVEVSQGVQEGDHIVVTQGPLKGREALIRKVNRHKRLAWVEFHMLGRRTTVKVGLEVVGKSERNRIS